MTFLTRLLDWWVSLYRPMPVTILYPIAGGSWDSGIFSQTSGLGHTAAALQIAVEAPDVGGGAMTGTGGAKLTGITLTTAGSSIY